jgi:hypothetical protein
LTSSVAPPIAGRIRVDLHDVLWLALMWIALIALWGASDRWHLGDLARRLAGSLHRPRVTGATRPLKSHW